MQRKAEKSLEGNDGSDRRAGQHGLCVTEQEAQATINAVRTSIVCSSTVVLPFFQFALAVYCSITGVVGVALTVVRLFVDQQVEPRYAHLQERLRLPIQQQQHQ